MTNVEIFSSPLASLLIILNFILQLVVHSWAESSFEDPQCSQFFVLFRGVRWLWSQCGSKPAGSRRKFSTRFNKFLYRDISLIRAAIDSVSSASHEVLSEIVSRYRVLWQIQEFIVSRVWLLVVNRLLERDKVWILLYIEICDAVYLFPIFGFPFFNYGSDCINIFISLDVLRLRKTPRPLSGLLSYQQRLGGMLLSASVVTSLFRWHRSILLVPHLDCS